MLKTKRISKSKASDNLKNKKKILNEFKKEEKPIPAQDTMLRVGQWLSSPDYFKVSSVDGNYVHIELPNKTLQYITTGYLNQMYSSVHYEEVIELTRTEVVDKLLSAKDKVFTAVFHKKLDPMYVFEKMQESEKSSFRNDKELSQLTKSVTSGDICVITGRLNNSRQHLGRTLVIDFNATTNSQIRSIDHRTIECLIIDKKKYVTKGSKKAVANIGKKLMPGEEYTAEAGDWYSKVFYFNLKKIAPSCDFVDELGEPFNIARDIVNEEMSNATLYNEVVRVTRTEMVSVLENVGDRVFTVTFNKKLDDKIVKQKLKNIDLRRISNKAYMTDLAETILTGEESTITGHLYKSETIMGRSAIIDLNVNKQPAYRQVDHRTLKELITDNKRYVLK